MSDTEMEQQKPEVGATSRTLKLQQFWLDKPHNWFSVTELQFEMMGIKADKEKFLHVLSALSPSASDTISDILAVPPTQDRYLTLKTTLLNRLTPSDESKLEAILSGQDLGDRRPSEALRHIKQLAGDNLPAKTIKSLWVRKMPEIIRIALVAQPESRQLDELAITADKLHEAMKITPTVAAFARQSRPQHRSHSSPGHTLPNISSSATVEDRLARIEARLNGLCNTYRNRSRSRGQRSPSGSGFRRRSGTRGSSNNNRRPGFCWYHRTHGSAARRCDKPCNFVSNPSTSMTNMEVEQKND